MPEVKKIATRESYGNALVELGKKHDDVVVLDADLAGATKTGTFKKVFPERHIDCGIAEADMMGIAAGIATTGKVPFASTFECEDRRNPCRHLCRGGRCDPSVPGGHRTDAHDPGHDGYCSER